MWEGLLGVLVMRDEMGEESMALIEGIGEGFDGEPLCVVEDGEVGMGGVYGEFEAMM